MSTMDERLEGYRRALNDHGIPWNEHLVKRCDLSVEMGCRTAVDLINSVRLPVALLGNDNNMLLGILLAVQQLGLRCPEDVAVVGFDEHPWASIMSPAVTVVRQPSHEIGRIAGDMLIKMLGGESVEPAHIRLEPELIIRESCGCSGGNNECRYGDSP